MQKVFGEVDTTVATEDTIRQEVSKMTTTSMSTTNKVYKEKKKRRDDVLERGIMADTEKFLSQTQTITTTTTTTSTKKGTT